MDAAKRLFKNITEKLKVFSWGKWVLYLYLFLFPLGKLLRVGIIVNLSEIKIDFLDLFLLFLLPFIYFSHLKKPFISKAIRDFFMACLFSLVFSLTFISKQEMFVGTFHFLRLVSYFYFFILVWNLIFQKQLKKETLYKALIYVSFFVAILGLSQYVLIPDLTGLKYLGWDDHLYRLAGTFLDPAFTGIILVFGLILSLVDMLENKHKNWLVISLFLIASLALTYNRASFLAVFAGLVYYFWVYKKKTASILVLIGASLLIVFLLPRFRSEGTLLERTQSIYAKISNYSETFEIFRRHPLFGVGFNNLCVERIRYFGGNIDSHACSGSDSSLLLVLATTGIVGILIFINTGITLLKNVDKGSYGKAFIVCFVALFVHSLFVQSAFYPFVMGYMSIIFALSTKT